MRVPRERRAWVLHRMLSEAEAADGRRRKGRGPHPLWGDGTLMATALRRPTADEPPLSDPAWCRVVAFVYLGIARRFEGGLPLAREDGA